MSLEDSKLEEVLQSLPAILSVEETAKFLNVSKMSIYRLISSKQLNAYKVEKEQLWNIRRKDLKNFIEENETINN